VRGHLPQRFLAVQILATCQEPDLELAKGFHLANLDPSSRIRSGCSDAQCDPASLEGIGITRHRAERSSTTRR
jgi:hypothetical protein